MSAAAIDAVPGEIDTSGGLDKVKDCVVTEVRTIASSSLLLVAHAKAASITATVPWQQSCGCEHIQQHTDAGQCVHSAAGGKLHIYVMPLSMQLLLTIACLMCYTHPAVTTAHDC